MSSGLRFFNQKIKTHSMRWVKKHCTHQKEYGDIGWYQLGDHEGTLLTPCMNREVCGRTFTVVTIREDFIDVKETAYSIPRWLLTEESQRRLAR